MGNWDRKYGINEETGNRVIMIEQAAPERLHMSLLNRTSVALMKLCVVVGFPIIFILGLVFRALSGA